MTFKWTTIFLFTCITSFLRGMEPLTSLSNRATSIQEKKSRLLLVAKDPTTNKLFLLLGYSRAHPYWSDISSPNQDRRSLEATLERESNGNYRKDLSSVQAERSYKGSNLYIIPVEYLSADSLKKGPLQSSSLDEFIWVPLDHIISKMTIPSYPVSSKKGTGSSCLALIDPEVHSLIKTYAARIKEAAPKTLKEREKISLFTQIPLTTDNEPQQEQYETGKGMFFEWIPRDPEEGYYFMREKEEPLWENQEGKLVVSEVPVPLPRYGVKNPPKQFGFKESTGYRTYKLHPTLNRCYVRALT